MVVARGWYCKKRIRQHLKLNPPIAALHICDDQKQSIDLAQIFFNKNTLHYLNSGLYPSPFEKFNFLVEKYKKIHNAFPYDKNCFCVDGSSILAVHGLRDLNVDFDFLSFYPNLNLPQGKYSFKNMQLGPMDLHNKAWIRTGVDPLETIFNPKYHFYYEGIKYCTLERIRYFKYYQNRPVDRKDVKAIDDLLTKMPELLGKKI